MTEAEKAEFWGDARTIIGRSWRRGAVGMQAFCACGAVLDVKTAVGDDAGPFKCPRCAGARTPRHAGKNPRRGDFVIVAREVPLLGWQPETAAMVGVVIGVRKHLVTTFRDAAGVEHPRHRGAYCMVAAKEEFRVSVRKLIAAISERFDDSPTLGDVRTFVDGLRR